MESREQLWLLEEYRLVRRGKFNGNAENSEDKPRRNRSCSVPGSRTLHHPV